VKQPLYVHIRWRAAFANQFRNGLKFDLRDLRTMISSAMIKSKSWDLPVEGRGHPHIHNDEISRSHDCRTSSSSLIVPRGWISRHRFLWRSVNDRKPLFLKTILFPRISRKFSHDREIDLRNFVSFTGDLVSRMI